MNQKITAAISAACIAALALTGCSGKKAEPTKAETGVNVTVYKAKSGTIENRVTYTGEIRECDSVSVTSRASAKALSVNVQEGDYVQEGDTLLSLDKTDISLACQQSQASYNSAVAGYNAIVNSSSKQATAQAQQALSSAQISYEQAKTNYDRAVVLYNNASDVKLAEQKYNDAKSAYEREKQLYDSNTSLISSQNSVTSAQNNYDRIKQLFDMGGATQVDLDNAQIALDNAKAGLSGVQSSNTAAMDNAYSAYVAAEESLKTTKANASASLDSAKSAFNTATNALNTAKQNIGLTQVANQSSMETAKASVNSAKAALDIAKNNLNNTIIKAPISGYIAKSSVTAGQNVAAGVEAFVIKNTNLVDGEINVTESVISSVQIGTKASVSVTSADIENMEGSVTQINPVKDEKTGLYTVKVTIENGDQKLKTGMFADITLTTATNEDIIKIPSVALIQEGEEYFVYVTDGKTADKVSVITGIADEEYTEIVTGVNENDKVVIDGKDYISDKNKDVHVTGDYKK